MSYKYYEEELNQLPPDDGYGIAIQVRCAGKSTKWMTLTDECKNVLRKFITVEKPFDANKPLDPESMTDAQLADYWHEKWEQISRQEEQARTELAKLLIDSKFCSVCPATWRHIIEEIKELIQSWKLQNGEGS